MVLSYKQQINTLLSMNVDILLIETVFDTLNVKAALLAYLEVCEQLKTEPALVVSVTISDSSGRTLSGQTLKAFWYSIKHANPLGVGLNCALGPERLTQYASELSTITGKPIWIYPNAGFPNEEGKYTQGADDFAKQIKKLIKYACVLGGCCGSTPEHISKLTRFKLSNKLIPINFQQPRLVLCGSETLEISREGFYRIGERANVAGSNKFKTLISSGDYERALDIVRQQAMRGAQIIDVNMDDALLDSKVEVSRFLNLINSEPDLSSFPIMIDSSDWETLLVGMKHIQGRGIVNSISLKDGDRKFIERAGLIKRHGCLPIVIAFDKGGQASTMEQRLEICKRVHRLLTKEVGFNSEEVIIDLNTFAIATGIVEHDKNTLELIKSIKLINTIFPQVNLVLGVSNLSFSFRGNNKIREALHCVFLRYAKPAGLNFGILNVLNQMIYTSLSSKIKDLCRILILNRRQVSIDEVLDVFNSKSDSINSEGSMYNWRNWDVRSRIIHAIVSGIDKHIEEDSLRLANDIGALQVIEGPLMDGMNIIGKLFGNGKMFLPQVIKAARVMKQAVNSITSLIKGGKTRDRNVIVMATVRGDVHDIGKNIVSTVLSCNNYKIIDLGTMVPANEIVQAAIKYKADAVGISGLISPSLDEMVKVARLMQKRSLNIPLLIGGATTSRLHTAIKLYPEYPSGIVVHVRDASRAVDVVSKLLSRGKTAYIKTLKEDCNLIIKIYNRARFRQRRISFGAALGRSFKYNKRIKSNVIFIGTKTNCVSNLKGLLFESKLNEACVIMAKATTLRERIINKMTSERWVSIRRTISMMGAVRRHESICVLNSHNLLIAKLPMLRQQLDKRVCLSLSDFVDDKSDNIATYCCVIGIESTLIHQYFKDKNRLQCASTFKEICDDLVEVCSEHTYDTIRYYVWSGTCEHSQGDIIGRRAGIRPAPGYPIIPDHRLKQDLLKISSIALNTGLITSDIWSFLPQTSILSMVLVNPYALYFGIRYIDETQITSYSKLSRRSIKSTESLLNSLICYVPKSILT
ncbi:Methionine synthase [Candidatus Hodgkinia cicadicola]|uniref:Methionine synthase n=1 Tax=Candidatus Hodgkinia cicadicola TaxID=573658 RepID=A0ABX4MHN6_9HYPH|nr:Methionine synthase [Candidatus Hodgkinia cicadicola]